MSEYEKLLGYEQEDTRSRRGQVYMATHKGEQKLPFMNRSFISFSFGGKDIEDFDLIATIENNRLDKQGSSEFEDLVDEYNIVDGQFYWGTHFKPNRITFKLATDGITQQKLDEFKYWFAGGKTRELILAEHPNRAILARVESPASIQLLPFEEPTIVKVNGSTYKTSTTKYKGEITLNLIMDMPFWYSKINIFGYYDSVNNMYVDEWWDASKGRMVNVFNAYENLDVMKIVLEDNIPISTMLNTSLLLGNNVFANYSEETSTGTIAPDITFVYFYIDNGNVEEGTVIRVLCGYEDTQIETYYVMAQDYEPTPIYNDATKTIDSYELTNYIIPAVNSKFPSNEEKWISLESTSDEIYAAIMEAYPTLTEVTYVDGDESEPQYELDNAEDKSRIFDEITGKGARIHGPYMAEGTGVISLGNTEEVYFYYAGTAPSYPILSFNLTPELDTDGYVCTPNNSYSSKLIVDGKKIPYNTITIESLVKKEFRFTTPNLYTSYNEAMKILRRIQSNPGESWENIRVEMRDNIKHHAVRAYVCRSIDVRACDSSTGVYAMSDSSNTQAIINDLKLFLKDNSGQLASAHYMFDSKNGKAIGTFTYRNADGGINNGALTYTLVEDSQEDIGDMIKSKYLVIVDRNHPDSEGFIQARQTYTDDTKTYSHILYHDLNVNIENLHLQYDNMYL